MSIFFLKAILAIIDSATWMLQQGKFFGPPFACCISTLPYMFESKVYIMFLWNVNAVSIDEARKHFQLMHPDDPLPNNMVLEKLFTNFLISHEFFGRMSTLFQGLLRNLGSSVSGDKELFHFLAIPDIMRVPSKPTRIGLWIPGQWNGFYHRNTGHKLINYYDPTQL